MFPATLAANDGSGTVEVGEFCEALMTITCPSCNFRDEEKNFHKKLLSIQWREKHDNIQAFIQIKCPKCHSLVTIVFETFNNPQTK